MRIVKNIFILIVVFAVFIAKEAYPSEKLNYANDSIPLRLKTGMITEAEFPDKIANVTKSVSSALLQIETVGNRMFLLAQDNFDSYLYVVTQDNFSYCLHLIMDDAQAPTRIKIRRLAEEKNHTLENKEIVNTVELMKKLINGTISQDAVNSKLYGKEIFNDKRFRIAIEEVYELPGNISAFILTFENLSPKPLVVPIEQIELPGLLAISVDSHILAARPPDASKKSISSYAIKAYMIVEGKSQ